MKERLAKTTVTVYLSQMYSFIFTLSLLCFLNYEQILSYIVISFIFIKNVLQKAAFMPHTASLSVFVYQ